MFDPSAARVSGAWIDDEDAAMPTARRVASITQIVSVCMSQLKCKVELRRRLVRVYKKCSTVLLFLSEVVLILKIEMIVVLLPLLCTPVGHQSASPSCDAWPAAKVFCSNAKSNFKPGIGYPKAATTKGSKINLASPLPCTSPLSSSLSLCCCCCTPGCVSGGDCSLLNCCTDYCNVFPNNNVLFLFRLLYARRLCLFLFFGIPSIMQALQRRLLKSVAVRAQPMLPATAGHSMRRKVAHAS